MLHKYDYQFKFLVIGESGVGKTCILLRFIDDFFQPNYLSTIGIDFQTKIVTLKDKMIKLQIWDTAGQERFRTITKTYYRNSHGVILTYDVTDRDSFKSIGGWVKQIEQNSDKHICKVLVGNKCDKEGRTVTLEEGEKLAEQYNMKFFESSAKTNYNVSEIFAYLTEEAVNHAELVNGKNDDEANIKKGFQKLKNHDNKKETKEKCCK